MESVEALPITILGAEAAPDEFLRTPPLLMIIGYPAPVAVNPGERVFVEGNTKVIVLAPEGVIFIDITVTAVFGNVTVYVPPAP